MAGTGVFVGRAGELSRLESALADRARLVLVVGDAGIGKTRLVCEGLAGARPGAARLIAVSGGCLPLAAKLPLLPVADALAELSRLDGGEPFEAALEAAPAYVRPEVARLLPRLAGEASRAKAVEGWRHERLFAAVAELLGGVARRSPLALLIEDVHWADDATLDFLTYLMRAGRDSPMSLVVTCRSDEVPLDPGVADWLTHVRRDAGVEEIRLGPLSPSEVAGQVSALVGAAPPAGLVEDVYARAEGHPFFTEQLVAAAVTDSEGLPPESVTLPARLAELLVARAAGCGADARAVLAVLSMAGRPLSERFLGEVTGLGPETVRTAVRELTAVRLLAAAADRGHRPRHALLGEAVAAELLPDERVALHERIATALEAAGDDTLAAEAAGHWAAAGRAAEELQVRLAAAEAAQHVFAYADAATHWRRAIDLCVAETSVDLAAGIDVPHLYLRAVDALEASGDRRQARVVAEDAYRRFADHPDRATRALVYYRVGFFRGVTLDSPAAGLPLIEEALRLFEGTPPTVERAEAWYWYAHHFLFASEGRRPEEVLAALDRALEIAEAAGAATLRPRILCTRASQLFDLGKVDEALRLLARARDELEASPDPLAALWLAIIESDGLLKLGRLEEATRVGLRGLGDARRHGLASSYEANIAMGNAVEGLLARGCTSEAAALIDPLTTGPLDWVYIALHMSRGEIDLLRGEFDAAAQRLSQIELGTSLEHAFFLGLGVAEVALWAGRPQEALEAVQTVLERLEGSGEVISCGWPLAVGMRACADLAQLGRARGDQPSVQAALVAAEDLTSWVKRERGAPFAEHPFVASIPAERSTWDAEQGRTRGASDPSAWSVAAERWEALGYRHRAGYARWRQAEVLLATPHGGRGAAATVLSTARIWRWSTCR